MSGKTVPLNDLNFVDLLNLPPELLLQVLKLLDVPQWSILRMTNKRFSFIARDLLRTCFITYHYFPHHHHLFSALVWKHSLTLGAPNHCLIIKELTLGIINEIKNKLLIENTEYNSEYWLELWDKIEEDGYLTLMEKQLSEQVRLILTNKQIKYIFEHKKLSLLNLQKIYSVLESKYKHQQNYDQQLQSLKRIEHNHSVYSQQALFTMASKALEPLINSLLKKNINERVWSMIKPNDATEAINWERYSQKINKLNLIHGRQKVIDNIGSIQRNIVLLLKIGFLYKQFSSFLSEFNDYRLFYSQLLSAYDTANVIPPLSTLAPEFFYAQKDNLSLFTDLIHLIRNPIKPVSIYWLQAKKGIYHQPTDLAINVSLSPSNDQQGLSPFDWAKKLDNSELFHRTWKYTHTQFTLRTRRAKQPLKLQSIIHPALRMNALQWLILCQRPIRYVTKYFDLTHIPLEIIRKKDAKLNTALHYAACNKHCDWLGYLLTTIPEKLSTLYSETINDEGYTPLLLAASKGNLSTVELLIKYGAKKDKTLPCGQTFVSLLSQFTPPINTQNYTTPLHIAAQFLSTQDFSNLLVQCPHLLNQCNTEGNTALHLAVMHQDIPMINFIISRGAETDIKNFFGLTAVAYARTQPLFSCFGLDQPVTLPNSINTLISWGFKLNQDNIYTALKLTLLMNPQKERNALTFLYRSFLKHIKEYSKPKNVYHLLHSIKNWIDSMDAPFKSCLNEDPFFHALQQLKKQLDQLYKENHVNNNLPTFFNHHKKKKVREELLRIEQIASILLLEMTHPTFAVHHESVIIIQSALFPELNMKQCVPIKSKL